MSYDFGPYGYVGMEGMEEVFEILGAILLGAFALVTVVMLVFYILRSLALYTIAKRRGLNNPWLAWIPVGKEWIVGSVSDQYQYVTQGKIQNRRKILLGLSLAAFGMGAVNSGLSLTHTVAVAVDSFGIYTGSAGMGDLLVPAALMSLISLASSAVGIAQLVFRHMSMYDLYRSCNPKNCVVFLVLGIIFPFTEPFFLMSCRYREDGMPPRKGAAAESFEENWTKDPEPFVDKEYISPEN